MGIHPDYTNFRRLLTFLYSILSIGLTAIYAISCVFVLKLRNRARKVFLFFCLYSILVLAYGLFTVALRTQQFTEQKKRMVVTPHTAELQQSSREVPVPLSKGGLVVIKESYYSTVLGRTTSKKIFFLLSIPHVLLCAGGLFFFTRPKVKKHFK